MNPYTTCQVIDMGEGDIFLERSTKSLDTTKMVYHTVLEGETIQSIAYKYYQDSGRWGDICDVNGIMFPFEELKPGMQIIIPF